MVSRQRFVLMKMYHDEKQNMHELECQLLILNADLLVILGNNV